MLVYKKYMKTNRELKYVECFLALFLLFSKVCTIEDATKQHVRFTFDTSSIPILLMLLLIIFHYIALWCPLEDCLV